MCKKEFTPFTESTVAMVIDSLVMAVLVLQLMKVGGGVMGGGGLLCMFAGGASFSVFTRVLQ
jgi:hypothetical protein